MILSAFCPLTPRPLPHKVGPRITMFAPRPIFLFACCALILSAPAGAFAQKNQIFVTASLTDRRGLFIEDLDRQEIQILEGGQPRRVEFIAREEVPTVYGILFDHDLVQEESNQHWGSRLDVSNTNAAKNFAYQLIDKYVGRQTVWVGLYDRELQVTLDFSTDGFRSKEAIQHMSAGRTTRETFLYSALYSSVMRMKDRNEKRRVLLLFLNLVDSETASKLKPLRNLLSSSNVELFIVTFASQLGSGQGLSSMSRSALNELAQATAGEMFLAGDYRDHPDDITQHIYNQLRTFYTFGFESESASDAPAKLTIRCTRPGSKVKCHPTVPVVLP